jgi:hypothetical protein
MGKHMCQFLKGFGLSGRKEAPREDGPARGFHLTARGDAKSCANFGIADHPQPGSSIPRTKPGILVTQSDGLHS